MRKPYTDKKVVTLNNARNELKIIRALRVKVSAVSILVAELYLVQAFLASPKLIAERKREE